LLCYALSAIGIVSFILVERRMGDDALIPLHLFKSGTFSMATVLGVVVGFGMFGAMMTIPLYLQLVNGATPTEAGLLMIPMIIGLMVASIVSGQLIARTGRYGIYPKLGAAFMTAAFVWLAFSTYDKPVWYTMIGMLLVGLGLGQLMQTLTLASQNAVGAKDIGVATSASTFFRQIGGTLGTAVIFSVLFARLPDALASAFGRTDLVRNALDAALDPAVATAPQNAAIMDTVYDPIVGQITANLPAGVDLSNAQTRGAVVDQVVESFGDALASGGSDGSGLGNSLNGDTSFLNGADPHLTAPFLDGFANAAVTVFWVGAAVMAIAFVLSLFLKTPKLREKSAIQEVLAEQSEQRAQDELEEQARFAADVTGAPIAPDIDPEPARDPEPTRR